jgi:hypothetical protein
MSENYYNRTLLYSGSNASSIALTEPISNFEYIEVNTETYKRLVETSCNWNCMRLNVGKYWTTQGYMDVQLMFKVTNSGSGLQALNYNFLCQDGNGSLQLLGSGVNRANNIKFFSTVYGINRTAGVAQTATGNPLTGAGWTRYNSTLLYSAPNNGALSFTLFEPASAFERLRICVGTSAESRNSWEVASPSGDGANTCVRANWGATSVNAFSLTTYTWSSGTQVCSSLGGKLFSPNWGAANPWGGNGTASKTISYVAAPIYAMYGINRKEV